MVTLGYLLTLTAAMTLYNARKSGPSAIRFGEARAQTISERETLIDVYRAQQKQAFRLTLIAVAAGVLLGVALITRLAMARVFDASVLTSVVGTAGDIWIGTGAMRLYNEASKRWEEAVRTVAPASQSMP
jgi:hypothetical protein